MWQDRTHPVTTPTRMRSKRASTTPKAEIVASLAKQLLALAVVLISPCIRLLLVTVTAVVV